MFKKQAPHLFVFAEDNGELMQQINAVNPTEKELLICCDNKKDSVRTL